MHIYFDETEKISFRISLLADYLTKKWKLDEKEKMKEKDLIKHAVNKLHKEEFGWY